MTTPAAAKAPTCAGNWANRNAGMDPVRKWTRSVINTAFIAFLACRRAQIRAEMTPLEQFRLAVRLAVHRAKLHEVKSHRAGSPQPYFTNRSM